MARTREFDEDVAVEKALGVFWEKGYDGAAVPDLLEAAGLSRSSLYAAFGDKKGLFLRTLAAYGRIAAARQSAAFGSGSSFRDGMAAYLASRLAAPVDGSLPGGCYFTSVAATLKTADEEVRAAVRAASAASERGIAAAFARALDRGLIPARLSAGEWTALYLAFSGGLNVALRQGRPRDVLESMVSGFLKCLEM